MSSCTYPEHTLSYTIHSWSSYSGNYHPRNVQYDRPNDQSSRWSSDSNYPPQFIMLKLQYPAVVTELSFGKYEKTHVCNLRKFTVYGGVNEEHLIELLTDGLKNDSSKETFTLRHELEGRVFPCRYLKIVPLISWGPSFNFSIWHIKIKGIDDANVVGPCLKWFHNYKEQEAIRLCLKHLRRRNFTEAFDALQKEQNVPLEDPRLTELHTAIVKRGDFEHAESLIDRSGEEHIYDEHIRNQSYKPKWSSIVSLNEDGNQHQPGMRGGHQMYMDARKQLIFLIGGWDGIRDLGDFWVYDISMGQWLCISENTASDGGPTPRSCHKICIDTKRRDLYTLGWYLDAADRANIELKSDFYRYDLDTGLWQLISNDTAAEGGPHLIFDHQMQYDSITDKIFIFGGRILTSINNDDHSLEPLFSGLYAYHVATGCWEKLRDDGILGNDCMKARSGHSMLIDEHNRLLYIFAGQRGKDYLNDFFSYNIDTGVTSFISSKSGNKALPSAGFTQRATIDTDRQEVYVFSGLSKDKDRREESIRNSFWVYSLQTSQWSCVYKTENVDHQYWKKMENIEPRPRYAHQLVYDPVNKVHFLFGGNPGKSNSMKLRLDDFWILKLQRPTINDIVRQCKYILRKLRYKELTTTDPIAAMTYLQNEVSNLVDHSDPTAQEEFKSLAASLFMEQTMTSSDDDGQDLFSESSYSTPSNVYDTRTEVFEKLSDFFPLRMTQPRSNITDFMLF